MLQNFKHQITCIAMKENVFLPLQQDFIVSPEMRPPRIPVRSTPMRNIRMLELCGLPAVLSTVPKSYDFTMFASI